jgi:pre-mRNA-splicing factor ISY1
MGERDKGNQQQREREFVSHVPLLDEKENECMVVEKKKHELLNKYTSEDHMEEQEEDKEMLNI